MEIAENRKEIFEQIAESFSWALSHSRVSLESLGEFATLLYLCKHDQLRKVSNSDCKEGENLFVLQFSPSMIGDEMEKWMRYNIACIGLMRKAPDQNPEIESILQRYRTTMRQHQAQDALIRTFDLIKQAELQDNEYIPLLAFVEQRIAIHDNYEVVMPIYPQSLSELLSTLIHDEHKAIYDPYIGTASLLMDLPESVEIFGNEINSDIYPYLLIKLALSGHTYHCLYAPVQESDIKNSHASCIVSFPPMVRDAKDERYIFESPLRLFQEDKDITELILIVPDNFLTSRKYQEIRKSLTDANLLEHVLKLPMSFFNGTIIAPTIIHLRKERVENYTVFYNLAEDAEKEGKRMEISVSMWSNIVKDNYDEGIWGSLKHTREELAENNYDWSCDTYPLNDCITGFPYSGDVKKFKDIMLRYYGESLKEWPENVLSFRKLKSPFDKPETISPRGTETTGYVRVTEPVFVIGYSNMCPLYYLEAYEDEPVYVNRREVLYRLVDSLVDPMYLACIFSRALGRVWGFEEYVYKDTMDPVHRIEKFLRAQKIGLPALPVQIERVKEFKDNYFYGQLQNSNMAQYVEAIKQQYIDEVRSRKHNMRPYLREIKSCVDIARLYAEKASSLDELKEKVLHLLDSIEQNSQGLADIVETLSQEDKFEDEEYLDVEVALWECIEAYIKNTNTTINFDVIKLMDKPFVEPISPEICTTWGRYALISSHDFRRMFNAIVENARIHGFEGVDEGHSIEITIDYEDRYFKITFWNNGKSLPEGFDIHKYGMLGGKAGPHAGTGDGGHQVVAIADHFGGWVELNSTKAPNPQQYVEVIVYLPIADKDWDEALTDFANKHSEEHNDDV